jgi:hypothetical protein
LENLKAVAKEGKELHNKVRLHVSVIAKKDSRELELLTFGGPNAPSSSSE